MRSEYKSRGVILYHKERSDLEREAALTLARLEADALSDDQAAQVGALFPEWAPGVSYTAGERISDSQGKLYRVVQDHVSQSDWPMSATPALYTPLGVTAGDPDSIPEWIQPTGAHDAYPLGAKVIYQGIIYESAVDDNVWTPGEYGWTEVGPA